MIEDWDFPDWQKRRDAAAGALERLYRNTWLCTNCGERHSITINVCPKHLEKVDVQTVSPHSDR